MNTFQKKSEGHSYRKLTDENARLKVKCEKLENRVATLESIHNDLANYGRHNNVVFSGIPENV